MGRYCPACGQRHIQPGIRFRDVAGDFLSYNFSIDGPIWRTLQLLVRNPGELFQSFIQGRRKDFYKPIQFFIIASLIYFGFAELISFDPLEGQFRSDYTQQEQQMMPTVKLVTQFMVRNINNLLFLLVFVSAAWLKVFRWKHYNYAEYLVVGFYLAGVYILIGMTDLLLELVDLRAGYIKVFALFLYFGYAFSSLFGPVRIGQFLLGVFIGILSFVTYFMSAFGFSYLWILLSR